MLSQRGRIHALYRAKRDKRGMRENIYKKAERENTLYFKDQRGKIPYTVKIRQGIRMHCTDQRKKILYTVKSREREYILCKSNTKFERLTASSKYW